MLFRQPQTIKAQHPPTPIMVQTRPQHRAGQYESPGLTPNRIFGDY